MNCNNHWYTSKKDLAKYGDCPIHNKREGISMSEPAAVSTVYVEMVNEEGLYFNEDNIIKKDLQNGKSDIIAICINKTIAKDIISGLNLLYDNERRLELE
jgi:hypothetical protein|tara:strand:- start:222 stop:521 length:300 start_codon:yes stop_codon:yes gene_type:complete